MCLVAVPLGVYVISYIPWAMIEGHQLITGWPAGHAGQTLLDLTAQMYRYHNGLTARPRGVIAVVGLAVEPQTRLVLPGGPRARHQCRPVRRRQPRHLVAGHPGPRVRQPHGLQAAQPGADLDRRRVRGPVGPVGAHRSGGLPVPLLHGAPVRGDVARLPHGRDLAWRLEADLAGRPPGRRARDHGPGPALAVRSAVVLVRRRGVGQSRIGCLSRGHPDDGHHRPDPRPRGGRHRRRHVAGQAIPRAGRGRTARATPIAGAPSPRSP